jgi:diguanylate cyclase (GGDEF)-like protein/PAS domain S-box-containing protein
MSSSFEQILHGVDAIVWEADPATLRFSFVSDTAEKLLGYPVERWYERDFWAEHIHPDDRERAVSECASAVERGENHELVYRCMAADGRVVWIRDVVRVEPDVLRGVMSDITAQRKVEDDLRFQAQLLNQVDAAVMATDRAGKLTHWNNGAESLFGWAREEALGRDGAALLPPSELARVPALRDRLERGEHVQEGFVLARCDGSLFDAWLRAAPVMDRDGQCAGFVGVAVDVTARKRAREELERNTVQQAMVASLGQRALEGTSLSRLMDEAAFVVAATLDVDYSGVVELVPEDGELILVAASGVSEELVREARIPAGPETMAGLALASKEPVVLHDSEREERFELTWLGRDHEVRSGVAVSIMGRGRPFGVLGAYSQQVASFDDDCVSFLRSVANVLAEAIERFRTEEETRHRALHDPLTNLPNRTLFQDRLEHALRLSRRSDTGVAVFFLDLDQFKAINDTLGHQMGDELLLALAPRLENALRPSDTVARFGGDEFVLLCEDVPDKAAAGVLADRIASVFERPFALAGGDHFITASIGIALASEGSEAPDELIRDADAAMYRAKARGRARYEYHDERARPRTLLRLQTEGALRGAIEREELRLCYQPVVDLETGEIASLEALIRWDHPVRGLLRPGDFIPIAESSDLIVPIGRWVLDHAVAQMAAWRSEYGDKAPARIGVNVSPRQVRGEELFDIVGNALHANGLPPEALCLELTETALMEEAESPTEVAGKLKALGVALVLDDFGTGYSSLSYLQRFPIDMLKIDRSFTTGLSAAQTGSIVMAVVNMAQALGLGVVAEGVETESQLYALTSLGCRYAQGHLFAPPMPAEQVAELFGAPMRGALAAAR